MNTVKSVKELLDERGWTTKELAEHAKLEPRVAQQIAQGQWTPSPQQRERIAVAFGVGIDEIHWGHSTPVEHLYGHGPQFGRSP